MTVQSILLQQLTKSDQIFQLLLVPLADATAPSLILTDDKNIFVCDFIKKNGLHVRRKISLDGRIISKIAAVDDVVNSVLKNIILLTNKNELYLLQAEPTTGELEILGRYPMFNYGVESNEIEVENPIIASNEKYTIVHSVPHKLLILPNGHLESSSDLTVFWFIRSDVIGIVFSSINHFQMISRNSAFSYKLEVFEITNGKGVHLIKKFNPFKGVPRLLIPLQNKFSLVICDDIHLIYPPSAEKLMKDCIDPSVKMTKVSYFKNLPNTLVFKSFQVIDNHRIMMITEQGDLYLEFIQMNQVAEQKKFRLTDWVIFKLGPLAPASNLLHINDNLFLNYSNETKNSFFRINPTSPNIQILNYFQPSQFFAKTNPILSTVTYNIESTPIVDINSIELINTVVFLKIQSTLYNSYISLKYLDYVDYDSIIKFKVGNMIDYWFDGPYIICQYATSIKIIALKSDQFEEIKSFPFSGKVTLCFFIEDELIVITPSTAIRDGHIVYQCDKDTVITLSENLGDKFALVTSDCNYHIIVFETSETSFMPGISCLAVDHSVPYLSRTIVMGFDNGSIKVNGVDKSISSHPILQLIVKSDYILLVDSEMKLFKILKQSVVELQISGDKQYEIKDAPLTDGFFIQNHEQLSYNTFDLNGSLQSKLLQFTAISAKFTFLNGYFISKANSMFKGVKLNFESTKEKIEELRLKELAQKSLLLRIDKKIPIVIIITRKSGRGAIKMIDLETFKIIDEYRMNPGEQILDIVKTSLAISSDDETKLNFLTEKELSLIELEVHNNGFLINTITELEDGRSHVCLKLFTVGSDMRLKFHFALYDLQSNGNVDSYKLLNLDDIIVSAGNCLGFFKIGINDKFKPNKLQNINENNFLENSILKILFLGNGSKAEVFSKDIKKISSNCVAVLDITNGVNFYKISEGKNMTVKAKKIKIKSETYFKLRELTIVEAIDGNLLIFVDMKSRIFIYKYKFKNLTIKLDLVNFFSLKSPGVNVISTWCCNNDPSCLLGCVNGELLLLRFLSVIDERFLAKFAIENLPLYSNQSEDAADFREIEDSQAISESLGISTDGHCKFYDLRFLNWKGIESLGLLIA